ncbi:MAG: chloride channel protein [Betaproteobacteria bacterium]|nr:chloride channel protein [Betaproteobacteria bacterium]
MQEFTRRAWAFSLLLALSLIAGILAALGAMGLDLLLAVVHDLFFLGRLSLAYDPREHTPAGPWGVAVIIAPVLGGFVAAALSGHIARQARGSGVPDILEGVFVREGRIDPGSAVLQPVATVFTIGSGGSAGREGPSMHLGAALASGLARALALPPSLAVALLACGTGAGIAASFNTPWGAWIFALEVAAPEWRPSVVLGCLAATWASTWTRRQVLGNVRLLPLAPLQGGWAHDWWVGLPAGALAGLLAWALIVAVHYARRRMLRMPGAIYLRHGAAMLFVGLGLYLCLIWTGHYAIEGVGYATADALLTHAYWPIGLLLTLFALKFLATVLTLGTGGSGGIFSPALLLGGLLGGLIAASMARAGTPMPEMLLVLAGMGGMVAASTGAIVGGTLMVVEMTGRTGIMVPIMLSGLSAYGIRRWLVADSAYTRGLGDGAHPWPENRYVRLWADWRKSGC